MPLVTNETEIEQPIRSVGTEILKFEEPRSKFIVQSHLYYLYCHWVNSQQYLCLGKDCPVCEQTDNKTKTEYYYYGTIMVRKSDGSIEGKTGVVRVPADVFFFMNNFEKDPDVGRPKRAVEWIITKTGEKLETKYSALNGKEIKVDEADIEASSKLLQEIMADREQWLKKRTIEAFGEPQQKINPDDIPF